MIEKRKNVRIDSILSVELLPTEASPYHKKALTRDISISGAKLSCYLPKNTRFPLNISLTEGDTPLSLNSDIVWSNSGWSGLTFCDMTSKLHSRLKGFIEKEIRVKKDYSFNRIPKLLKTLSRLNARKAVNLSEDLIKLIYYRQQRLTKTNLKERDIKNLVRILQFHIQNYFHKIVNTKLSVCFGKISEDEALSYYENYVMGNIVDIYERDVVIDERGMRSLYKSDKGEHIVESKYYSINRAKRLPWIRYVIQNTKEIYKVEEYDGIKYIYAAKISIPLVKEGYNKPSYFVVILKRNKDRKLYFKTAYAVERYNRFLKIIECGEPYLR